MNTLGIYEKALPYGLSWKEKFTLVRELGFHFLEFSIDESPERLSRLDWGKEQCQEILLAMEETGIPIYTLMLSGHRKYPLGSLDPEKRKKALLMMEKALDLAINLGIRHIQLAGYDVYYESKSVLTREYFLTNLTQCVAMASRKGIMLSIETMDDPFLNSLSKITLLKNQIHSPWLQAYPDLGNLSAWPENDVAKELEIGLDHIVAIHLKDTYPVTNTSSGQFRDVPFGTGCVDFEGCLRTLKRLNYQGPYTIEMWSENQLDPITEIKKAQQFFMHLFKEVGIQLEGN